MSYRIEYTKLAQTDLDAIYRYIAFSLLEPEVAANIYREIIKSINSLDSMPSRNPLIDSEPWKSRGLRKMIVKNYIVFYTVGDGSVTVNRIMYGGRDVINQL